MSVEDAPDAVGRAACRMVEMGNRVSDVLDGENTLTAIGVLAMMILTQLEASDAPTRTTVMEKLLPLLRELVGTAVAFESEFGDPIKNVRH